MIIAVISLHIHSSQAHENSQMTSSQRQWLHSSVGSSVRRTGIARSRAQTPLKSWLFQASIRSCLNCVHNCDDHSLLDKKTKSNICHHMLTLSTQLQNRSFHVVERTRTSVKRWKMHVQSVQKYCFFIVKYANLWVFCCRRRSGCLSSLLSRFDGVRLSQLLSLLKICS